MDYSSTKVAIIELQKSVIVWNKAITRLLGIQAEEIIGNGNFEYAIPLYGTRRPVLIDYALNWDDHAARPYKNTNKDGGLRIQH